MIQRDFYECSTLIDAQGLVSHMLANGDGLDNSTRWSNIISHTDSKGNTVYYVKINRAYSIDISEYLEPSGVKVQMVTLNTRSGNEEGGGTTFTHYPAFDERMGMYKIDTDGDGVVDALDAFPNNRFEDTDTDGDGVGDNSDPFPNDPTNGGGGDSRDRGN